MVQIDASQTLKIATSRPPSRPPRNPFRKADLAIHQQDGTLLSVQLEITCTTSAQQHSNTCTSAFQACWIMHTKPCVPACICITHHHNHNHDVNHPSTTHHISGKEPSPPVTKACPPPHVQSAQRQPHTLPRGLLHAHWPPVAVDMQAQWEGGQALNKHTSTGCSHTLASTCHEHEAQVLAASHSTPGVCPRHMHIA